MSHIPNSAMPHAAPSQNTQEQPSGSSSSTGSAFNLGETLTEGAGRVAEMVRENPKAAAAAGAAIVAGIAAAAIPLVRGRGTSETGSTGTSGRSKSTASKSTGSKSTGSKTTTAKSKA